MNNLAVNRGFPASPPVAILGVPFDHVTTQDAVALVERMVALRRPHYFVTANVDFLVQARGDVELRRILLDAHLVLCDGTPLLWASRLLGNPLPERVAGSDLVPLLVRMAAEKHHRLFFLGGTPESTAQAVAKRKAQYPQLSVEGYSPPFNSLLEMDHDEIKRRIQEAGPDLLFVSLGCPKQEKWIAMHYESLGVPVAAGVGATIDFLAGQKKRAPAWMQNTGTEWVFRLLQEPRRLLRRYVKDLWVFGWAILAQLWRLQFHRVRQIRKPATGAIKQNLNCRQITPPARLDMATVRHDVPILEQVLADGRHCLLQMSGVEFIDSTGVGWLIRMEKTIRTMGRELVLLNPSPVVKQALSLMRLQDFFATASDFASAERLIEARVMEDGKVVCAKLAGAAAALAWQGEITAANAEETWRLTEAQINQAGSGARVRAIDLSQVRFIDSSGLEILIRARQLAHRQGLELEFTGIQPTVRNVLHLARLDDFFLKVPA